jgi:thimet oligopeptidase
MNKQHLFLISFIAIAVSYGLFIASAIPQEIHNVITIGDLVRLFPNKPNFIEQQTKSYIRTAKKQIKRILDINDDERTFANTAKALDNLERLSDLAILSQLLEVIELLSPVKAMRNAAHDASIKISQALIDMFSDKKLYHAFKAYVEGNAKNEELNHEQRYFLEQTMIGFKRGGLELDDETLDRVKNAKKELTSLTLDFDKNIAEDNRTVEFTIEELEGLPDTFIAALKRTNDGKCIVGVDYPSYFPVMQQAIKSETRRKLYQAFNNRGYPANEELLKKIIAKRDELAQLLGYPSYAHYDLDEQMVKSPERARTFLNDLIKRADLKEAQEFQALLKDLPEGVVFDPRG